MFDKALLEPAEAAAMNQGPQQAASSAQCEPNVEDKIEFQFIGQENFLC